MGHEWCSPSFQREGEVWAGMGTFSGSTLGSWLVSQTGVWLPHACNHFGGAKTSKEEQDPSDEVWQECLQQASNLGRTARNWVSWGKSVVTWRGVKAEGAVGKRQHDGEGLVLLCEAAWRGPLQVPVHKYVLQGKQEKLAVCAQLQSCAFAGTDVMSWLMWLQCCIGGYRLCRKDKPGRQWGRFVLCAEGWLEKEPVESLWLMIRGCFHCESGQTLEQGIRRVVESPSSQYSRPYWAQQHSWTCFRPGLGPGWPSESQSGTPWLCGEQA